MADIVGGICLGDVQKKQQKLIRGGQQKLCIVFYW